jgi:hypothetical protein
LPLLFGSVPHPGAVGPTAATVGAMEGEDALPLTSITPTETD